MMRKKALFVLLAILITWAYTTEAQTYRTETFSTRIQTLRVLVTDKWDAIPIINLNSNEQIEINFDLLGASPEYFTYRILHCNADWTVSQLTEPEYLSGLQYNPIMDYENSFNTKMDYVNYRFYLPNENAGFKVSGNYAVEVYSENGENPVLTACFSVIEPQAAIQMNLSSVTDQGANYKYQAVSFDIDYGNDVRTPVQELKVYVQQNNRRDNEAQLVKPLNIQNRKAIYDHSPSLIFSAGNEYRKFEMTTTQHTGLNIEAIEYHSPYYHSILLPDLIRSDRSYSFYDDINGRVFIRNQDAYNSDIEADYQFVHFYLPCDRPLKENVYILSDTFHNLLDFRSQMEYSERDKGYIKTVLLKEGYYNYLYVTRKSNTGPTSTELIEGDFYQTENEYRVMVYFRSIGMRYDKLIGVQTLQFK